MTRQHQLTRRVLVVEDSPPVSALVADALEQDGFSVDEVAGVIDARSQIASRPPDVVVLDLELRDGSGVELLREIVAGGTPAVVLSARSGEVDRVLGLELGADDYVTKPFYPRELAVRVRRAASRRAPQGQSSRLEAEGLVVDRASREAWLDGKGLGLTDREFELLAHLMASPRRVFSRDELLRDVWRSSREWQSPKTVTEHVRRLRQKIEQDPSRPRWITTVGSAGYRFDRHLTA